MKISSLLLCAALAGCATTDASFGVHVEPIYQYRGYGEYLPDRDAKVLASAKSATADVSSVKFLQETLPEGVEMDGNRTLSVARGYQHQLLGKLAYSTGKLVPKLELVARVKQIAAAAGGDAAIGLFIGTDNADYTKAQGVEAVIMKLDPRFRGEAPKPAAPLKPETTI